MHNRLYKILLIWLVGLLHHLGIVDIVLHVGAQEQRPSEDIPNAVGLSSELPDERVEIAGIMNTINRMSGQETLVVILNELVGNELVRQSICAAGLRGWPRLDAKALVVC